jgi:hypothetical protein
MFEKSPVHKRRNQELDINGSDGKSGDAEDFDDKLANAGI